MGKVFDEMRPMKECKECGKTGETDFKFCPECGNKFATKDEIKLRIVKEVINISKEFTNTDCDDIYCSECPLNSKMWDGDARTICSTLLDLKNHFEDYKV